MRTGTLALIGGTGSLGQLMAKGLKSTEGFTAFKALVRPQSIEKAKSLEELGWTVQGVDFSDADALEKALSGTNTVVSAVSGGDLVATEMAIIDAAKKAGVKLFVPSQFGVDTDRWGTGFPFLAGKQAVLDHAEKAGLPVLRVFTGMFPDWTMGFLFDIENAKATIVGDESTIAKVSFTKRSDIGNVLAKALADPKFANGGDLYMSGDTMTYLEALSVLEKVTGKKFELETISGEEGLTREEELLKKGMEGDMGAFFGSFRWHLLGEPGRGNAGGDMSESANNYGLNLATVEETFQEMYGSK